MLSCPMLKVSLDTKNAPDSILLGNDILRTMVSESSDTIPPVIRLCMGRSGGIKVRWGVGTNHDGLTIHSRTASSLNLKQGRNYGFQYRDGILNLGPVFGIMLDVNSGSRHLFGNQDSFVRSLILQGQSLGEVCFAFSPYSINWKNRYIQGYTWNGERWSKKNFPLPDVIYYRGAGYGNGKKIIRSRLEEQGCKFINPVCIDKWKTHCIIAQNHALSRYLPETHWVDNFNRVRKMLERYRAVYLKPAFGAKGQNIIRLSREGHGSSAVYHYQHSGQNRPSSTASLTSLHNLIRSDLNRRRYIIQRKINLIKQGGRLIDIRVLVQKDQYGEWDITGMACRMGGPGSITSNLSGGGKAQNMDDVLCRHFKDPKVRENLINEVQFLSLTAVRTLEQSIGRAGEMGVDIGIDQMGKIWFIEANLRPARRIFAAIGEMDIRMMSIRKPLYYARYLAGFAGQQPELSRPLQNI